MIVILGVPGAGKSSLSKLLSVREHLPLFPEPVESNPYLTDYYRNPEQHAFNMQIFLLHERFKQTREASKLNTFSVMDASMHVNDIFARLQCATGILTQTDYKTYSSVSNTYHSLVSPPDLVVYLQCSVQVAVNRIMRRGRPSELDAPLKYWYDLNNTYEQWYEDYEGSKKMLINVDDIDFVSEEYEEDYVIDSILEYL